MASQKQTSICREGWYYITVLGFIIAGAMIRDINLLFILAGMMLGPLVLSWLLVNTTLRKLAFQRQLPDVIGVDDLLVVDLVAESQARSGGSWAVVAEDRICRVDDGGVQPVRTKVLFPRIPVGSRVDGSYRVRLRQRGRYRLGPLKLTTRAPLGLIQATITHDLVDKLLVCPRLGRLLPAWGQILQLQLEGGHKSQRRQGKLEGDYYGLRDWRSGDSRRWIHWRTSARRGELTVKQFEQRKSQDLAIIVELWQPNTPEPRDVELVEQAISFAATLVGDSCRKGNSHLLVACTGTERMLARGTSSPVFLQEVMQSLATVQADHQDHLPELLSTTLPRVPTDARIVLVTTRPANLRDTERFTAVWEEPRQRRLLTGVVQVQSGSPDFARWFESDLGPGPGLRSGADQPSHTKSSLPLDTTTS